MSEPDPSLDARIWAYVRGEGSQTERKKLEAEVGENPVAARRYATIKLKQMRQTAHEEHLAEVEGTLHLEPKSKRRAKLPRKELDRSHAKGEGKSSYLLDSLILAGAVLLLFGSSTWFYLGPGKRTAGDLMVVRDILHGVAALLAICMFARARHGSLSRLALAFLCIAVSCGLAAMIVL